jgi:hypothetical protein
MIPTCYNLIKGLTMNVSKNDCFLDITGDHFFVRFDGASGRIISAQVKDTMINRSVMPQGSCMGWQLLGASKALEPLTTRAEEDMILVETSWQAGDFTAREVYTITPAGCVICQTSLTCRERINVNNLRLGIPLDRKGFLADQFRMAGTQLDPKWEGSYRAMEVSVGTKTQPDTAAVNFLLEYPKKELLGVAPAKVFTDIGQAFLGWEFSGNGIAMEKGSVYTNRWAVTFSAFDNRANKVRSQRIYHWYGQHPHYPDNEVLEEMQEYGCSIFVLHEWSKYLDPYEPADAKQFARVVQKAHELGMKILFYLDPYLVSLNSPMHKPLENCRTGDRPVWLSKSEKCQVVFYRPNLDCDCDEVCLRCKPAFDYLHDQVLKIYHEYKFDGLYVDFAWPAENYCNDTDHDHEAGMFGFFDYWRILRSWRKHIGDDAIMIAHGGGYLVASDMVEAFDACLTGEAQRELDSFTVCQRCGKAPTLWTMHRRKFDAFRSYHTVASFVREGVTPHVGVGVMGTSIVATMDPAHWREVLALWQIWRAFPVQEATFYNYLTAPAALLSNDQIAWSLYSVPGKYALLVLAHGPVDPNKIVPVRCPVKFDCNLLKLSPDAKTLELRGSGYENFRINPFEPLNDGKILVGEVNPGEIVGIVIYNQEPPKETMQLIEHLKGRPERLAKLLPAKIARLQEFDRTIQAFAHEPTADTSFDFMADRQGKAAE